MAESVTRDQELNEKEFLLISEFATRYRVSVPMAYYLIAEKRVPEDCVLKLGRKILINRRRLMEWEAAGGHKAA